MRRKNVPTEEVHGKVELVSVVDEAPGAAEMLLAGTDTSIHEPKEYPVWVRNGLWLAAGAVLGGCAVYATTNPSADNQRVLPQQTRRVQTVDVRQAATDVEVIPVGTPIDILCADYGFGPSPTDEKRLAYGPLAYKFFSNLVGVSGKALAIHVQVLPPALSVRDCADLPQIGPVPSIPGMIVADTRHQS